MDFYNLNINQMNQRNRNNTERTELDDGWIKEKKVTNENQGLKDVDYYNVNDSKTKVSYKVTSPSMFADTFPKSDLSVTLSKDTNGAIDEFNTEMREAERVTSHLHKYDREKGEYISAIASASISDSSHLMFGESERLFANANEFMDKVQGYFPIPESVLIDLSEEMGTNIEKRPVKSVPKLQDLCKDAISQNEEATFETMLTSVVEEDDKREIFGKYTENVRTKALAERTTGRLT